MGTNLSGLALIVAIAAIGVAGYGLTQASDEPSDVDARLVALEDAVARMERTVGSLRASEPSAPSLLGLEPGGTTTPDAIAGRSSAADASPDKDGPGVADGGGAASPTEEIVALVDKAVAEKAAQMQFMATNKKPSLDAFAETLELTDEQREAVAQQVLQSQHKIKEILEIRTADGTNLLDELVEVMADGMARPGKDPGRGMRFFGRLMSENVPGTDETYAARIERVKGGLRDTFRRDWSETQYAMFEAWKMDPTEIQDIEGSPYKEIEVRLIERARELGADIPDRGDR